MSKDMIKESARYMAEDEYTSKSLQDLADKGEIDSKEDTFDSEDWAIKTGIELGESQSLSTDDIEVLNSEETNEGTVADITIDGEDWRLYSSYDVAESDALQYVTDMLEEEPELFSPDWIREFYDVGENEYTGEEELTNLDVAAAAEDAIATDGVAHFMSWYDGNEIELPSGAVAYRTN